MKRIRMLVSVILVMAVMLSTFLMPAAAATIEDDTVEPCAALLWCPECDQMTATYVRSECNVVAVDPVISCDYVINEVHDHEIHHSYDVLRCSKCGLVEDDIRYRVYCTAYALYI